MHLDFERLKLGIQPQVLAIISKLDPNSSMDYNKLGKIIKSDPNITAIILRVANSKFFAHESEVKTLHHAIGLLGLKMLRSMTMLATSKSIFGKNIYNRFRDYVWKPSIATALIAKEISLKINYKDRAEECFIMGLLHRIGDVVLNTIDRQGFITVLNKIQKEGQSFSHAEKAVFQTDYTEVGFRAAQEWNFPALYALGIKYHNKLEQINDLPASSYPEGADPQEENRLIFILGMAHYITNAKGFGSEPDADEYNFKKALEKLNINSEIEKHFLEIYPGKLESDKNYKYYLTLI